VLIRSLVFRLEDHDKTLVLGLGSELRTHRGRVAFSPEEQVRSRLLRRIHDADCMDSLRRWMHARGGSEHGLTAGSNHELIDSILAAIHSGRIAARLAPTVGATRTPAGQAPDDRTRQFLETVNSIQVSPIPVSGPPATRSTLTIPKMAPTEKIEGVLKRTIPKLPAAIRPEFVAMIASVGVARVCEVLAGWAASQFVGVGELVDLLLALALAVGVALTGWSLYTGAKLLLKAVSAAIQAQTEADLDAAATTMAEAVTTLGVAVITLGMMRGMKGGARETAAPEGVAENEAIRAPSRRGATRPREDTPSAASSPGSKKLPSAYKRPEIGSMSNVEARLWYHAHEDMISLIVDKNAPIETQARQAFEFRNEIRTAARDAMKDRAAAEKLWREDPNLSWDELKARKRARGVPEDKLYDSILQGASKSRDSVDQSLGIKRK
jgi:hypothetical protein